MKSPFPVLIGFLLIPLLLGVVISHNIKPAEFETLSGRIEVRNEVPILHPYGFSMPVPLQGEISGITNGSLIAVRGDLRSELVDSTSSWVIYMNVVHWQSLAK